MPIARIIFARYGLAYFRSWGDITVEDTRDALLGYIKDPEFDPEFNVLVNREETTLNTANFREMRRLSILLAPYYEARSPESRTAIYCPSEEQYSITRVYQSVSEFQVSRPLHVARTKSETLKFLGYDPDDAVLNDLIWPEAGP